MNTSLTLQSFASARDNSIATRQADKTYVGIDFGTSTTVASVAAWRDDTLRVNTIPIPQRRRTGAVDIDTRVPTCIAFSEKLQEMYVGIEAYEARFDSKTEPGKNVWFEFNNAAGRGRGAEVRAERFGRKEWE